MKNGKLFRNIFVLCLCILLITVIVFSALWVFRTNTTVKKQYINRNDQLVQETVSKVDKKIEVAFSIVEQLSTDTNVVSYAQAAGEKAYLRLLLRNRLSETIDSFAQLGCEISVFDPQIATVITSGSVYDVKMYLEQIGAESSVFEAVINSLQSEREYRQFKIYPTVLKNSDSEKLLFVFKHAIAAVEDLYVLVSMEKSYLFNDILLKDEERLWMLYNGNPLLLLGGYETNLQEFPADLLDTVDFSAQHPDVKQYKAALVSFERASSVNGMSFVSIVPRFRFLHTNIEGIIFILLLALVVFVFGVMLAYVSARKIYLPIGNVIGEISQYNLVKEDDEAHIIRNTFKDIMKTNQELETTISWNNIFLKEKFLKDILYGIWSKESLEQNIKKYNLEYLKSKIIVIVVEFVEMEHMKTFSPSDDRLSVKREVMDFFRTDLKFENGFELFEINDTQFVVITAGYTIEWVKKNLSEVTGLAEVAYNINLLSAAGRVCENITEIQDPFYDALNMLGYKMLFLNKNVITTNNCNNMETYYYPLELERSIILLVQKGEKEDVFSILQKIVHKNYELAALNKKPLMEFKFAIGATIKRIVQMFGKHVEDFFEKDILDTKEFYEVEREDEFTEILQSLFGKLMEVSITNAQISSNNTMDAILKYIHENYSNDFSLSDMAEYYNISPGYVGKLFRENMDTTFKDYLNQYRIEVAKRLLEDNPDLKIGEIAEMVGYTNAISFNRVFNRYVMMSPSEYRKSKSN